MQTSLAQLAVTVDPTMRALTGNTLRFRRMRDRPALNDDAFDQQQPPMKCQTGLRV